MILMFSNVQILIRKMSTFGERSHKLGKSPCDDGVKTNSISAENSKATLYVSNYRSRIAEWISIAGILLFCSTPEFIVRLVERTPANYDGIAALEITTFLAVCIIIFI